MNDEFFSAEGEARRREILSMAHREAARRKSRRRTLRGGPIVVIAITAGAFLFSRPAGTIPTPDVTIVPNTRPASVATVTKPDSAVVFVQTDPTITQRLAVRPERPRWVTIDNHELITELAAAGRPGGVVTFEDRSLLVGR